MFTSIRRLIEQVVARFTRVREPVLSRDELSKNYMRELQELVDNGELGAKAAARIRSDLFDPGGPGEPPQLRLGIWQSYLQERTGHVGLYLIGSRRDPNE